SAKASSQDSDATHDATKGAHKEGEHSCKASCGSADHKH
ncbi:unnamed protein product, partial [Rotaria magnacalcarata]